MVNIRSVPSQLAHFLAGTVARSSFNILYCSIVTSLFASTSLALAPKGAGRFCLDRLSERQQYSYYRRMLTFGASYSRGCLGCDFRPRYRSNFAQSDDAYWFRRSPLLQFWAGSHWLPKEFNFESIAIAENDPRYRESSLLPKWQTQRGYDGLWLYNYKNDFASLMDPFTKLNLASTNFYSDVQHIGGIETNQGELRDTPMYGVLYQSIPGSKEPYGAEVRQLFDLSIDGSKKEFLFEYYGNKDLYNTLSKQGWRDIGLRNQLIQQTADHLLAINPTIVLALDLLFWDSISHSMSIIQKAGPKTLLTKVLIKLLTSSADGKLALDDVRRENITADFYTLMTRLSQNHVPVLLAQTMKNADAFFNMHSELLGPVLSEYIRWQTGLDLGIELSREKGLSLASTTESAPDAFGQNLPPENSVLTSIVNAAIDSSRADIPMLIHSLGEAFQYTNDHVIAAASDPNNNVYLIEPDVFYNNFSYFIKPETMHPDVQGAKLLARFFERDMCSQNGGQP